MGSFLERVGGMVLAPRATVATLDREVGQRDGLWLGLLWAAAAGTWDVIEAVVTTTVVGPLAAVLGVAGLVGRLAVPPVLVLFACELALGPDRAHRRGTCLAPGLAVGAAVRLLARWVVIPAPSWVVDAGAGVVAVAVAFAVRSSVPREPAP